MHPLITPQALTIDALPAGTASIDVHFDGQRVWSIDVRDRGTGSLEFPWPAALLPYLDGRTRVSVHDSAAGVELASAEVEFGENPERISVLDRTGAPLVINKWGRLGLALEAMGESVQRRILDRALTIIHLLDDLGLRPFVVGGTLLGGVRDGKLLPHDDDADLAYLSEYTHPADVAAEGFRVGAQLAAQGFEIRRHSATHLQLLFRDEAGNVQHYIDVFAAFFSADGQINQPFHVRGKMRRDQMLPFRSVWIDGTEFPGPADPEHWLEINYDANWRTPIPGYVLETPVDTRRRFDSWFGAFNLHREFWDEYFASHVADTPTADDTPARPAGRAWDLGASWLVAEASEFSAATLIDLGCGDGSLTRRFADPETTRRVIGLDYSDAALARAKAASPVGTSHLDDPERVSFGHANLYRMTALRAPRAHQVNGPFDIVANHVFEQIGDRGREQAWRLFRMALRSGGNARFTFHAHHAADVSFEDPTGWHLDPEALEREAAGYGMRIEFTPLARGSGTAPGRRPTGAKVQLGSSTDTDSDREFRNHAGSAS